MTDRVTVRRADRGDVDRIVPLFGAYREFYHQEPDPAKERTYLTERMEWGECAIFVAESDGEVVGFTLLYPLFTSVTLGPTWVLNDLYVRPEARRHGVGRLLLERAREFGKETSAHYLTLETATDNPAQRLYEAAGWKKDTAFLHYELTL
ncbi:MAG TPA: GNAT family N-acetyltransferase [Thermoplasmata archaeon]|nr:GNAT family N-acetyltransferase [Thermoplasmata archaeon]